MDGLNKIMRAKGNITKYNLLFISTIDISLLIMLFGEPISWTFSIIQMCDSGKFYLGYLSIKCDNTDVRFR